MTAQPIDEAEAIQPELPNFYVTFGQQYRQEDHPFWPAAHPDGYVKIMAPDDYTARWLTFKLFDSAFSMIHSEEEFFKDPDDVTRWYPRGELGQFGTNIPLA